MDERGNVTESRQGNGVVTTREYNPATGRLEHQTASILGITQIQDLTYQWDNLGNLDWRKDQSGGKDLFEDFEYDGLNRLKRAQVTGRTAQTLDYDGFGNITHKSDMGISAWRMTTSAIDFLSPVSCILLANQLERTTGFFFV